MSCALPARRGTKTGGSRAGTADPGCPKGYSTPRNSTSSNSAAPTKHWERGCRVVPAPPLCRGAGKSQCCRQGTGGATAGESLTSLLARKTTCIPQIQSFSQFSPPASMTAPLAPPHGRGASWQAGELEFPSPAHFHPSFRAGRTAQPLGTETLQTPERTTLVRPHGLRTQHRARSSPDLAPGEQEEPNQAPRSRARSTHPHELPALQHSPQGAQTPCVCFC